MSTYKEFKELCRGYYESIKGQKIVTAREQFHIIDRDPVIVGWTGNITANYKNGDTAFMNNYSITSVFRKFGEGWKVIHDHESAPPPEIIK